jgi:hypothetical protein
MESSELCPPKSFERWEFFFRKSLPMVFQKQLINFRFCIIKLDKKRIFFTNSLRKFNIKASWEILSQFCNQSKEKHILWFFYCCNAMLALASFRMGFYLL